MKPWMTVLMACLAWTLLTPDAAVADQPLSERSLKKLPSVDCHCYESGGWRIQQTDNFRICTRSSVLQLTDLPARCELLRSRISSVWLGDRAAGTWSPRCDVIVHASLAEYQQALGPGVGRSVGCATMTVDNGRLTSRRIDIRADADAWAIDALPHELTHVVLAGHFNGRRLPPWADEGIGVLSESSRKQQIRADAFRKSALRGFVYRPGHLLNLRSFPAEGFRDAFYAQSAALVRELVDRSSHREFIRCVELTLEKGETAALANVYNIHSPASLNGITDSRSVGNALSREPVTAGEPSLMAAVRD